MRVASLLLVSLALAAPAFAQQRPAVSPDSCLIVKHKGTIGRRLVWWTLIGVPIAPGAVFDYVDSIDFRGAKLKYGGKDLQGLQATGLHIIVLNDRFKAEDVDSARGACREAQTFAHPSAVATSAPAAPAITVAPPTVDPTTSALLGVSGYSSENGFNITSVRAGSPAADAYFRAGDTIAKIDGREVHTGADVESAARASGNGTVTVSYLVHSNIGTMGSEKQLKLR